MSSIASIARPPDVNQDAQQKMEKASGWGDLPHLQILVEIEFRSHYDQISNTASGDSIQLVCLLDASYIYIYIYLYLQYMHYIARFAYIYNTVMFLLTIHVYVC